MGKTCCAFILAFWSVAGLVFPAAEEVQHLTAIGSGIFGQTGLRTQIELLNEGELAVEGTFEIRILDGFSVAESLTVLWVGEPGRFDPKDNQIRFSIPPQSSVVVTLRPGSEARAGWATIRSDGPLEVQGSLQVAEFGESEETSEFAHFLRHQAELFPLAGIKRASFPIWLFQGARQVDTAFAVVNTSGVPGTVRLTFRPGVHRDLVLDPGAMIADYFDRFWQLPFPAIYPFELRAAGVIESNVPLGVTVLRTLQGFPLSGVKTVPLKSEVKCGDGVLGEEATLAVGECALFDEHALGLEIWDISEDSRCPSDVVCVWEGRVTAQVRATLDGRTEQIGLSSDSHGSSRVGSYSIRLVRVDPVPMSEVTRSIEDYRVTIIVTRVD